MHKTSFLILSSSLCLLFLQGCFVESEGYGTDLENSGWEGEWEKMEYRQRDSAVSGDPVLPLDPGQQPCVSATIGDAGCADDLE